MQSTTSSRTKPIINTRKAERREVHLNSLEDLQAEIRRIEQAATAGMVRTTGNWTLAQIVDHCAIGLEYSLDGFPFKAPWLLRVFGPMMKGYMLKNGIGSGIKLDGKSARYLVPPDNVTNEQAFAHMHRIVDERLLTNGEKFTRASPVLGKMTHEQTTKFQLHHCGMHLSFVQVQGG